MARPQPFPEQEARDAIASSICWAEALRKLGYQPRGHNFRTIQRWARRWNIDTSHFNPSLARRRSNRRRRVPLSEVMVEHSAFSRGHLKARLLEEGVLEPRCALCQQGEIWHGRKMSLILDHINGVPDDHRLENLRLLCANCDATLDTHCGRNLPRERDCVGCGRAFAPRSVRHRYCTLACFNGSRPTPQGRDSRNSNFGKPRFGTRKVERPPRPQLLREIEATSYLAVGRKYGVSDNAIRKWVRQYEREAERAERLDAAA